MNKEEIIKEINNDLWDNYQGAIPFIKRKFESQEVVNYNINRYTFYFNSDFILISDDVYFNEIGFLLFEKKEFINKILTQRL
ncbi:MAG: hypothetical protein K1X55_00015 [Chitinophagales bacterium]|nr:hypothetical protein [Chitinophagales bacterium]